MRVIYDDSIRVPPEVGSLVGITRFGRLIYQRRPLFERFIQAADAAGVEDVVHVRNAQDLQALRDQMAQRPAAQSHLYIPSNLVASHAPATATSGFLGKLRYALPNLRLQIDGLDPCGGILLMDPTTCRGFLSALVDENVTEYMATHANLFSSLDNTVGFVDLRDYATFLEYLTRNFEVRHFNSIQTDDAYTISKRSRDKEKLRREFDYFGMIPDYFRIFFMQPFGFEESGESASYQMERLLFPDMALQWIHRSLTIDEFSRFLDHVFHFVEQRPRKRASIADVRACADALYLRKLEDRFAALRAAPLHDALESLLASGGTRLELDELFKRFKRLYSSIKRPWNAELVLGHGDLCFSNILYGKSARILKLIDPRGAATADELFTDPYYDVAKLSHSVLGNYDYINYGLFNVYVGSALGLELELEEGDRTVEQDLFRGKLAQHGFNERLTRLYEASLFLSMMPLHSDVPRKMVAFALTADRILNEVEDL